jgi:WD40 repeat protein
MISQPVPMILKSQAAIDANKIGPIAAPIPVISLGTTYTMAQEAVWIDDSHYAVGRWDGSLCIFTFTEAANVGPIISRAVNSPAQEGIQMITAVPGTQSFFTSNDEGSIALWYSASGNWTDLTMPAMLTYDPGLGVANSGDVIVVGAALYFVVGHANGRVTIWSMSAALTWAFVTVVDVRSPHPVNPWNLTNVRSVAAIPGAGSTGPVVTGTCVVTGSEDGNLTVVRVPDGAIMSATVYNPAAQRGINSIALSGTTLLLANCAVGAADFNLWCYSISTGDWSIATTDKARLAIDPSADQVFNFDVVWAASAAGTLYFACSTQEGALWMGTVAGGILAPIGYQTVASGLGAALCSRNGNLALTAHDLYEFDITG